MPARERRDRRRDVAAAEAERRVDAQQALRRLLGDAELLRQVVDAGEDAPRVLEVDLALGRQAHPARRAVDERGAEACLHLRQVLAHRRGADAELAPCGAEAAGAREHREEAEVGGLDGSGHAVDCQPWVKDGLTPGTKASPRECLQWRIDPRDPRRQP
jgi:hypothetical protein